MNTINIYLIFNGQCEAAFNFYKSALGGEFAAFGKFKDVPPTDGAPPLSASDLERVMHVALPISSETILMGSDSTQQTGPVVFGNNFSVSINTDSQAEADRLFNALSDGGQVLMPMTNTFWGAYFGMFSDKFGISWMINYDFPTA